MTYIKLAEDMSLTVTQADTIYRGENMSKAITFLIPATIVGSDTQRVSVLLSYIRSDGTPDMVLLKRHSEMYNHNYYQYVMPVTCKLSRYPGAVCVWLQFLSGGGTPAPTVSKSGECIIRIRESKNIDDCLSDHQLTAFYQLKTRVDRLEGNDQAPDSGDDSTGDSSDEEGFDVVEF